MGSLYYLAFRDIASASLGVLPGEIYRLDGVDAALTWETVSLAAADWVPWDEVANVFRNKRVCFVVHGFNANVDHGLKNGGPMAQEFEALGALGLAMAAADLVVPVLWPGDGLLGWSWFNAFQTSKATGQRFAQFLASPAFTARDVSFISHSLGARVVLETVAQARGLAAKANFDTAVLTAAAVDDDALDAPEYAAASAALRRIVVLSSMKDEILALFFTLGDAAEAALWWSYDADTRALGRYGPTFAGDSTTPGKTEWYEVSPEIGQGHEDYFPTGWLPPPIWSDKQKHVSAFARDILDGRPLAPDQPAVWGIDHTPGFRPGWPPRF